jgi:hypothetical protein
VTHEEIKLALTDSLPLRPPRFAHDTPGRQKVSELEDYLLESAYRHAELEEALHWTMALIEHFKEKIENITGYEIALPRKPRDRITQADINAAKRTVDGTSFELGAEMKQLRDSILRQIARFEFEKEVVSRAYSFITG